jgi:hypothetical protein
MLNVHLYVAWPLTFKEHLLMELKNTQMWRIFGQEVEPISFISTPEGIHLNDQIKEDTIRFECNIRIRYEV